MEVQQPGSTNMEGVRKSSRPSSSPVDLFPAGHLPEESIGKHSRADSPAPQGQDATSLSKRPKRNTKNTKNTKNNGHNVRYDVPDPVVAMTPLAEEERCNFNGWVELESEPDNFNYILREYGVKDVKVQEIWDLQDEMLSFVPKPVYGLVFLFQYKPSDDEEIEDAPKCPKHVWFANQTVNNACATVALLNIVMNVPGLDLGESLTAFKEATRKLKPPFRGKKLSDNEFIRSIHNSFMRRIDVLNADQALKLDYEKWKKKTAPKRKIPLKEKPGKNKKTDNGGAYHFVAYVPVQGEVWRLDGLQRQPINLGKPVVAEDWVSLARDSIKARMEQYMQDGVEFNLMALSKAPLVSHIQDLTQSILAGLAVEQQLDLYVPDWKAFSSDLTVSLTLSELTSAFGVSEGDILIASISPADNARIERAKGDPGLLMALQKELVTDQKMTRSACMSELSQAAEETSKAKMKTVDYTPYLYHTVRTLAEEGTLRKIVVDLRDAA